MKKKVIFSVVLTGVILVGGVLWFEKSNAVSEEPKRGSATYVSWTELFSSVDEMEEASDIGIIGVLSESVPEVRENVVFTRNIVEVKEVYSGDVQVGDYVEVLQTGGTYENISTPAFSEIPLMEPDKEYALFLKETEPHEEYGQYYLIAGGYQGFAEISTVTQKKNPEELTEFTDYFTDNFDQVLI
jgi:hypothetical protein